VAEIKEFDRRAQYAQVVQALPDVLRHLHRTVLDLPSDERPGVHATLAAAYSYAVATLYRLGRLDLTHLADERARPAAAQGNDPLRAAVAEWNHALILMSGGSYPVALHSIDRAGAIADISPSTPAVPAIRGALHLRAANRMRPTSTAPSSAYPTWTSITSPCRWSWRTALPPSLGQQG
jgi:hypothetical protein